MKKLVAILFLISLTAFHSLAFQTRDYLTQAEIDLVKDTQVLDKRVEVFIKAIDRRLIALDGVNPDNAKQIKKDVEKWGELPTGSRAELIRDIAKILDEAITNIDDVSYHDERNPLVPKALRKLATEVTRVVERIKPLHAQAKGEAEMASFAELIEHAESILQAAAKLPPPAEKKSKSDKTKSTN